MKYATETDFCCYFVCVLFNEEDNKKNMKNRNIQLEPEKILTFLKAENKIKTLYKTKQKDDFFNVDL